MAGNHHFRSVYVGGILVSKIRIEDSALPDAAAIRKAIDCLSDIDIEKGIKDGKLTITVEEYHL